MNWLVSTQFTKAPSRLAISYTYFQQQVTDGNVKQITSTGNTIEGDFKQKTRASGRDERQPVVAFKTELPDLRRQRQPRACWPTTTW